MTNMPTYTANDIDFSQLDLLDLKLYGRGITDIIETWDNNPNQPCPVCGSKPQETEIEIQKDRIVYVYPCECRGGIEKNLACVRSEYDSRSWQKNRIFENNPGRFADARIKNYPDKSKKQYLAAVDFVENFSKNGFGMLFLGGVGTGKTHLIYSIINSLIEKNIYAKVVNVARLIQDLNFGYHNRDFDPNELINPLYKCHCLGLVDLGKESTTEATRRVLYLMLEECWQQEKPILVDSNFKSIAALKEHYSSDPVMDEAISDRLLGMCKGNVWVFKGHSHRITK